mmetsp:Transcript_10798/g.18932  ORF Transcript_10798/g.18932 Transcript_10798/m.18932 type:complete len:192 (-) Transcript_10798:257-832(-)
MEEIPQESFDEFHDVDDVIAKSQKPSESQEEYDEIDKQKSKSNYDIGEMQFNGEPPEVSKNPWFLLSITTVYLVKADAAQVAKTLIELSEKQGNVTKVNPGKFTIRAQVRVADTNFGELECGVKIRFYKQSSRYALEFQMRDGDAVAFNLFYQKALQHLKVHKIQFHTSSADSTCSWNSIKHALQRLNPLS